VDLSLKADPNDWKLEIVLFCFLGTVGIILFLFLCLIWRIVQQKLWRERVVLSRLDIFALVSGGVGIMCILYGFLIEPYSYSVTNIKLFSEKLRSAKRSIRIVQISDLHCDPKPRLEEKLPDVIADLHPDAIVFTGDGINSPNGLPVLQKCLKLLVQIAPTYVVKGNWDVWFFKNVDRYGETGVNELDGPTKVNLAGAEIWICGLPAETRKSIADAVSGIPENAYRIFLYHYPDFIEEAAANKIDLYLAGHTHGGQVALPFYGALMTLSARGKQFESGLYKYDNTHLYVNRGIGMEGGPAPRVRFLAKPEITLFELSKP